MHVSAYICILVAKTWYEEFKYMSFKITVPVSQAPGEALLSPSLVSLISQIRMTRQIASPESL